MEGPGQACMCRLIRIGQFLKHPVWCTRPL